MLKIQGERERKKKGRNSRVCFIYTLLEPVVSIQRGYEIKIETCNSSNKKKKNDDDNNNTTVKMRYLRNDFPCTSLSFLLS